MVGRHKRVDCHVIQRTGIITLEQNEEISVINKITKLSGIKTTKYSTQKFDL